MQPAPKIARRGSWVKSKEEIEAEDMATGAVSTYQGAKVSEYTMEQKMSR